LAWGRTRARLTHLKLGEYECRKELGLGRLETRPTAYVGKRDRADLTQMGFYSTKEDF